MKFIKEKTEDQKIMDVYEFISNFADGLSMDNEDDRKEMAKLIVEEFL